MNQLSFIPLGGIGDVTKNMYLYEYDNQILIVDCGLGFADETMLGVDLLLPDISYLLDRIRLGSVKIVGMVLTHGHEDHIGALPFVLPSLPNFPIFATPLTAALANGKLKEFGEKDKITTVRFGDKEITLGNFKVSFIRVTHSVPDSSNILIKTPVGNFYHGSDFKFDDAPYDKKITEYSRIEQAGKNGIYCLMSDCLGMERQGRTPSEMTLGEHFLDEIKNCKGKFIVTTYSSNISRLNQIIEVSEKVGRRICFIGRSLTKTKDVALSLGYLNLKDEMEVSLDELARYNDDKLTLIVAGSQGQGNSAMARIVNNEHKEIKLSQNDTVVFSSDPIPGNETSVFGLIDTIAKKGIKIVYSSITKNFHVSGHGSQEELKQMIELTKPKKFIPIGGGFRHMLLYKNLALELGYNENDILLIEDGQEILFSGSEVKKGKRIPVENVYVDEFSGEELEGYILRDRKKLSEGGAVIALVQINSSNGQMIGKPDIIIRGFTSLSAGKISGKLMNDLTKSLGNKKDRITDWVYIKKMVGNIAEKRIFKELRRRPLVLPIVIEV